LDADDHKQYLLADGSRAMTGSLNMGTKNITNVGTVDGVDVTDHSDRHIPNAVDALPTESAIGLTPSSTNTEGTHAYFARADHTHQITGFQLSDTTNGCRITANQTTTLATAVNVNSLTLAIGSGEVRDFQFVIFCGCSGNSGTKFAIAVPNGATFAATFLGTEKNDAASFVGHNMNVSGELTASSVTKNTTGFARIRGIVVNGSNAGNIQFQFASASAGQTSTIYANSYGIGRVMA
jgi:hypothetical protein